MAQEVRHLVGIQGTGPSSVDTTGYDKIFLTLVNSVWRDIQTSKKTWKWMTHEGSFLTQVGKRSYTPAEVFGVSPRLRDYKKDIIYLELSGNYTPIKYIPYQEWRIRFFKAPPQGMPFMWSIIPSDNSIVFSCPPDQIYGVYFSYTKTPQRLVSPTDQPEVPSQFHMVIVYAAVASYCSSMGLTALQQEYSQRFTEAYDQMVRDQVPSETFNISAIV